jgi:hypothetical protein
VAVLSLAACGGGGGGTPSGTLPLNSLTADAVVAAVLGEGGDVETIGDALFSTMDALNVTQEGTFGCPEGGFYTVDLRGNPVNGVNVTLNGCEIDFPGDGINTLNGFIDVATVSSDTFRMTFDVTGTSGMNTNRAVGDMKIYERLGAGSTEIVTVDGNSLGLTENGEGITIEKYRFVITTDLGNGDWMQTMRGYLRATALAGTVYFETPEALEGPMDDHPEAGVMILRGANGSRIRLTLLGQDVRVELDADGDGVYEAAKIISWDDL